MFSWIADRLYITRTYSYFFGAAVLTAMAALHGCSGGGGDGGGGGGSVGPSYSLSSSSVAFSASQDGATPPPQVVTVTVTGGTLTGGTVFIGTSQTGGNFSHTFELTGPTSGQITIIPGVPFNAGTFSGTITVQACSDAFCKNDIAGSPKTIEVTYTVTGLGVAPTGVNFESITGQIPAPQNVTLSLTPGGSASWTSSVNYTSGTSGWLTLTPAGGTLNPSQTVSLAVNAQPASPEVRTATVTSTAGALTRSVAVSYTISTPGVNFVAPYVAASGVGGNVIVRGHGFSTLQAGTTTVQFGGSAPSMASVLSDSEIRTTYPALAAGNYNVTVSDGGTTLTTRSGVKLAVVNPLPFPSAFATITRSAGSFGATDLVYDAERRALYLMDQEANSLEQYQFVGAGWSVASIGFSGGGTTNRRIALSPDGTLLLKTSGDSSALERIDTVNFSPLGGDDASLIGSFALNRIAFANDGTALGNSAGSTTLYRHDMLTGQFIALDTDFSFVNRHIAASADGDTLVLTSEVGSSGGSGILTYDASNGTLTQRTASNATDLDNDKVSISRDGSRILLLSPDPSGSGNRPVVYDASFAVLGRLPVGLNGFVVKPDGSAAYGYYPGTTSVRKFNLNAQPDGSGVFPELGSGTPVPESPGTSSTAMTMSPDGSALFLAGDQRVIVQSAP